MRVACQAMIIAGIMSLSPLGAKAGCVTGAAVGGVAGHVAGHHAVLGAAAGCAIGHHEAVMKKRQQKAQANETNGQPAGSDSNASQHQPAQPH